MSISTGLFATEIQQSAFAIRSESRSAAWEVSLNVLSRHLGSMAGVKAGMLGALDFFRNRKVLTYLVDPVTLPAPLAAG